MSIQRNPDSDGILPSDKPVVERRYQSLSAYNRVCVPHLYPVEQIVVLFIGITLFLYWYIDIPLRVPGLLYSRKVAGAFSSYFLGLLLIPLLVRLNDIRRAMRENVRISWRETLEKVCTRYLSWSKLCRDLRIMHMLGLMFVVYIQLKHLIPFINAQVWDAWLEQLESDWFGGELLTSHLIRVIGSENAIYVSEGYTLFYPYIALLSVSIVLQASAARAHLMSSAFVLLWFLAIFIEYAFPTWGPCFSSPEIIAELPFTLVTEMQQELWRQRTFVLANPQSPWGMFLISGLPSLHFALVLQGSMFFSRVNVYLGACSWFFLVVTGIATIYFGWHFVSDLFASIVLVFLADSVARWFVTRSEDIS